ncbi:MAG: efflux RND transporter periplasmic adaptor subunit [Gemmatimonadaceae bacterium]|nr:efflux RND transporter periplasmic adaptor subunit [Gemmatimonadaceae bacterium]
MTIRNQLLRPTPVALVLCLLAANAALACGGGASPADDVSSTPADSTAESDLVVLDTAAIRLGGIRVAVVDSLTTSTLQVTGTITYDANRVSHVGSRTEARVLAVRADLGARVGGDAVLAMLESAEVGQLRAEERQGEELVAIARENFAREQRLESQGISSRKELLLAEAELRRGEAALRSTEERLAVLGAAHDHGAGAAYSLIAPFAGTVVARNVSLGEAVGPADVLFTVADLSVVWIELDIFERDFARVRAGQSVVVTVTAYPGRRFLGRLAYVGDVLDETKRTVRARVEIPNGHTALKPGMFATASIEVGGDGPALPVVPLAAVQEVDGRRVVFVPGDAPGEFRPVPVELGDTVDGDRVVIRAGIQAGSRVVIAGAFALRSELAKGEIGEHGH